tara:strand:- start:690 stop:872 length:183 start_codon:yes stop_codon:yes gene_type:complete
MNSRHISLRLMGNWREKEKLNADLEAEEERLLENNLDLIHNVRRNTKKSENFKHPREYPI